MLPFHPDIRLSVDQLVSGLDQVLLCALGFFKRGRLNTVKVVVPIARLLREGDGTTLAINCRKGLHEGGHGFVNHVAVNATQNRAPPHEGPWQNVD
jgi:hypothetical protein